MNSTKWNEEINELEVEGQTEAEEVDEETDEEDCQVDLYEGEETNEIMATVFGEEIEDEDLYM